MDIELEQEIENRKRIIREAVEACIEKYQLDISEIGKENLIIHLTLSITRQMANNYISTSQSQLEQCKNLNTYYIARDLVKSLAKRFDVILHHIDYYYTAMYLANMSLLDLDFNCQFDMIDEETEEIIDETLNRIEEQLGIDLRKNVDFFNGISLHFIPALERLENDEQITENPLNDTIQLENKKEYHCAEIMNDIVQHHYHKSFTNAELCYISMHFSTAFKD